VASEWPGGVGPGDGWLSDRWQEVEWPGDTWPDAREIPPVAMFEPEFPALPAGETDRSARWPLPALQLTGTSLPRLSSSGFGISSIDLYHTWIMGYEDLPPIQASPGLAMHWWSGPEGLDLPPRVYDIYLDLFMQPYVWNGGRLSLGVTPGLYGDFDRVSGQTFQWTGWLAASQRWGEHWTFLGGVAYLRQLRSNWLPVGGAIWSPHDDLRLELIVPKPKVSRRVGRIESSEQWLYLAGQFGGGAWSVTDTAETTVLVNYSDLRLFVGWEGVRVTGREWRVELGYVFARELAVDQWVLDQPSDTFVAQILCAF
jgi:hypothetical protein